MLSATIMIVRRGHLSAITPPSGPKSACGSKPAMPAIANALALPVVLVIHHSSTNCVRLEPIRLNACPSQMLQKRGCQLEVSSGAVVFTASKRSTPLAVQPVAAASGRSCPWFLRTTIRHKPCELRWLEGRAVRR